MAEEKAEKLLQRHKTMVSERALVEPFYECAAEFFAPLEKTWWAGENSTNSAGPNWNGGLYSGAGIVSLNRFANFLQGNATPASTNWMRIQDGALAERSQEAAIWYAEVTDIISNQLRGDIELNGSFYVSKRNEYRSMGISYGVSWLYEHEENGVLDGRVVYQTVPSHAFYYQLDEFDRMVCCSYSRQMTTDQLYSVIGKDHPHHEKEEQDRHSDKRRKIVQMVILNRDAKANPRDFMDFLYQEYWIDAEETKILMRRGYRSQPFHVTGWHKIPNSHYYVGPAYDALPDMVSAAAARRSQLQAMAWAATPPLLGGQKIEGAKKTLQPRRITWNAISARGHALVQPMNSGANPGPLFNQVQDDEARVRSLMGNDELLSTQRPNMSATEAAIIAQERAAMVAPFAVSVIPGIRGQLKRHFEIAARTDQLPEPPDIVREQGKFEVDVLGPLAMAAQNAENQSFMTFLEQASFIEQMPSSYVDKQAMLYRLAYGSGNAAFLRDFDVVQAEMQQQAQLDQQAQIAAIAEQEAKGAKASVEAANGVVNGPVGTGGGDTGLSEPA